MFACTYNHTYMYIYYVAVTCIYNDCNKGMSDLPDMYAPKHVGRRPEKYIGNSEVPMLQLICKITLWQAGSNSSQKFMT